MSNPSSQITFDFFHLKGEEDTSKFLDCKTRGSSGGSTGAIIWDLNALEHLFSESQFITVFILSASVVHVLLIVIHLCCFMFFC